MHTKHPRIELPKLLEAAKDRPCVNCGTQDKTVVRAYYCGIGAGRLGKGKGVKVHDYVSATLCAACHAEFDSYHSGNTVERGFDFLMLCFETLEQDFIEGLIK